MSYSPVISHIQDVLHKCGDHVNLIPTGSIITSPINDDISIEITLAVIKAKNNCFEIKPPTPKKSKNPNRCYIIRRIRIPSSMIINYLKGNPYSDNELIQFLSNKDDLFAYY